MQDERVDTWRSQSAVTRIGRYASAVDAVPADLAGIRGVSQQLVAHYMGASDGASGPVIGERLREVDLRYADAMLGQLLQLGQPVLARPRPPEERIVGCCRDFALLFVAMARHKGIPARIRVGYASYFVSDYYVDHVIAEVWDRRERRWRLVEPEIGDQFVPKGEPFDPLDVPVDRFLIGPRAWLAARAGEIDPERFVVDPDLDIPYTRGWLSLRHHVVQDLAALNKAEMLLWDQWGMLNEDDPLQHADLLGELARAIVDSDCSVPTLVTWACRDGLRVTSTVVSYSPANDDEPRDADVRRTLEGMLEA